jgi:hypothetical protein
VPQAPRDEAEQIGVIVDYENFGHLRDSTSSDTYSTRSEVLRSFAGFAEVRGSTLRCSIGQALRDLRCH